MKPAAEKMKLFLQNKEFKNPELKLISNVTALPIETDGDIKDLLYKQIFSQVRWRETVEYMINNDNSPNTAHTINKVPVFLINSKYKKIKSGKLADVAPTILSLMNIEKPQEMTGKNLLI